MPRTLSRRRNPLALHELEGRDVPAVAVPSGFAYFPVIESGLNSPAALETTPDGRVFVALQNGTIRVVQNDQLLNDPLVVLNAQVDSVWERGLLGLTLDPNFATNGYLYVYYTASAPTSHNRISRLTVSGNAVVPGSELIIYELPSIGTAIYHMGGAIHFGPDGKLFVSVGDHQQTATPQSMTSLFGKVLRLNADGTIPTDNPFYNTATGDFRAIWATGLRNPFTKAFDPATGKLFINDVGNTAWEEVNSAVAGANFGWPTTEGDFNQATYPAFTRPFHTYSHSGACAITGGAFYSPTSYVFPAAYHGKYFFADFCAGWIRTLDPVTGVVGGFATGTDYPIDLRVSSSGAMYFITRGAQTGGQPNTGGIGKIAYIDQQSPTMTLQPTSVLVSTGETATFAVQAAGTPTLTFQWERSLSGSTAWAPVAGAISASITVAVTPLTAHGDRYRAVVTNAFGTTTSNPATLSVTANVRPTATVTAPANGNNYNAGQTISFAGLGMDPEDGTLPASAYHWQVDNYTGTIPRPVELPNNGDGYISGSFVVPTDGIYKPATVSYRIFLTVTDSGGLAKTSFVDIYPNTSVLSLSTQPATLGLLLDDQPIASPTSFTSVVGFNRVIEAPLFGTLGTTAYQFASWSDGGARRHTAATPATNTTFTAAYTPLTATFVSDLPFVGTPTNGWGPVERDRSNGETGATDGNPIRLAGVTYAKGLGVHANSEVIFNLAGLYGAFFSDIGVDDEVNNAGSVIFQVWVDGVKLYDSGVMTGASATKSLLVDVTNKSQLRLVVTNADNGNGSDHADWANARLTNATIPAAPLNVQGTVTGYTAASTAPVTMDAHLSWHAVPGAASYKIERKLAVGGTYAQVGTATGLTFDQTGLAPGSNYFYRVRANNALGDGAYSYEVIAATPALPPTPTNAITTAVTTTAIALRWTDNGENEDGFQIFRSVNQGAFALLTALPPSYAGSPATVNYTDSALTPGTRYDYQIRAFNLAGYVGAATVGTLTRTLAPTGVVATPLATQVSLTWTATPGAGSYSVYRGTTPGGQAVTPIATGLATPTFLDTGLTNGVTYYYTVTATNAGGVSDPSAEASATPQPLAVQSLIVNGGTAQRSRLVTLTVNFTSAANAASLAALGSITLTRTATTGNGTLGTLVQTGASGANGRILLTPATGLATSLTLTFDNADGSAITAGTENASLADGRWQLAIPALAYTSPLNALGLHRLFGDANGDGTVDGNDLSIVGNAFNSNAIAYDFDNNATVDGGDLTQFGNRFGISI